MPLTIIEINQAKTDGATLKLPDKDGLYLRVTKKTKGWRFDFRFDSRRYTISYGLYPTVSPAKARELHQEARRQLAEGINPAFRKRLEKLARGASFGNSVEATARHRYEGKEEQRSHAWREAHGLHSPHVAHVRAQERDCASPLGGIRSG
ncbi:Arm DNA-binding domain-containing protein [Trinickia mobilis]|uniref:Arm DNA-binding domain-containing protein n=1 Tax=Trinickia mobilis TaxID=2816356 RepID=UPI001A90145C|nr:Arm DNA-binding domain-containing protein [Trinickia mobilis]